jgi:hypothetical protein
MPDPSSSAAAGRRMAGPPLGGTGVGLAEAEDRQSAPALAGALGAGLTSSRRAFRQHSRSVSHQKNGASEQEGHHQSYEMSLANHGTLTFVVCVLCY